MSAELTLGDLFMAVRFAFNIDNLLSHSTMYPRFDTNLTGFGMVICQRLQPGVTWYRLLTQVIVR